jgi:hypothetical protein
MSLRQILLEKKSSIVNKWCDLTLQTYPKESHGFFAKKDQFGNPVGHTISQGLAALYDVLLDVEVSGDDPPVSDVAGALDSIIRIRAIQDFTPSEAVSFVLGLKSVIREELGIKTLQNGHSEEWAALDERIDGLILLGFDLYSQCRQKIFDIRVTEVKRRSERLLQMAGLTYEVPEFDGPEFDENRDPEDHKIK